MPTLLLFLVQQQRWHCWLKIQCRRPQRLCLQKKEKMFVFKCVCSVKRGMNKTSANVNDCNLFFSRVQILQKSHIVPKSCHFCHFCRGVFDILKSLTHTCERGILEECESLNARHSRGRAKYFPWWHGASVFICDICLTTAGQTILIYDLLVFSFVWGTFSLRPIPHISRLAYDLLFNDDARCSFTLHSAIAVLEIVQCAWKVKWFYILPSCDLIAVSCPPHRLPWSWPWSYIGDSAISGWNE